jgi:formylglycine-generating enzyme required for sulfatase activity
MRMSLAIAALLLTVTTGLQAGPGRPLQRGMVRIEAGMFRPLFRNHGETNVRIAGFAIDTVPVSQSQFRAFAQRNPHLAPQFLGNATSSPSMPATRVSWFAAEAYCKARGARLPTTNEWEYVALASESQRNASGQPAFRQRVLELAMRVDPRRFKIGTGLRNVWGVRDTHGGVTEWTHDFGHHKHGASCAAGTVQTGDGSDYAAFMRYSFRSATEAGATAGNVGFRCASNI